MKRRGIVLVITLMVASIISMSAVTLYYMARDDMAIAGNMRRISKTKMAATSGIQHFQAMNLFYNNILDLGGGSDPLNIIPETNLAPGLSYKVDVSLFATSALIGLELLALVSIRRDKKLYLLRLYMPLWKHNSCFCPRTNYLLHKFCEISA